MSWWRRGMRCSGLSLRSIWRIRRFRSAKSAARGSGSCHRRREPIQVSFEIDNPAGISGICLSFQIVNQFQQSVAHAWRYDPESEFCRETGTNRWNCEISSALLNFGRYSLRVFLSEPPGGDAFETLENVGNFEVVVPGNPPLFRYRPDACAVLMPFHWSTAT